MKKILPLVVLWCGVMAILPNAFAQDVQSTCSSAPCVDQKVSNTSVVTSNTVPAVPNASVTIQSSSPAAPSAAVVVPDTSVTVLNPNTVGQQNTRPVVSSVAVQSASQPLECVDPAEIQSWLEPAVGEWYSTKGNLAMTIPDGSINGCKVLGLEGYTYDYPRSGTIQVAENTGNRNMKMDVFGNNIHQYLIIDNSLVLRRSIYPEYHESVSGLYLGMTKEDVLQHRGNPTSVDNENGMERWDYSTDKIELIFRSNIVAGIRIYKDSNLHFDKSGLSVSDAPAAYVQSYGMSETPVIPEASGAVSPEYKIGSGEKLLFSQNYIQLSV